MASTNSSVIGREQPTPVPCVFPAIPVDLIDADHVAAIRYEHSMLTLTSDVSVSECGAVFIDRRDPAALIDGMLHLGQIMAVRGGLCRLKGNTLMLFYR
ncbi:ATP-binding protein [Glutamicibacter halophytocola]|nr:ATP-binding protein [Glutamicibacter halophytocola]